MIFFFSRGGLRRVPRGRKAARAPQLATRRADALKQDPNASFHVRNECS